ncbi:hypothetical protein HPQ61_20845 [Acetobacteraceae bacterium]|nr:hypothetical protein [Acetobacteraceae bacterium]
MPVVLEPIFRMQQLTFPACLAFATITSAFFYIDMVFLLLLLPVVAVFFIVCLIRFSLQPTKKPKLIRLFAAVCVAVLWGYLFRAGHHFGDDLHWAAWSSSYKRNLYLANAPSDNPAGLYPPHMLWRVWGGFGADTEADLVFDHSAAVAQTAAKSRHDNKSVYGCQVVDVHQLEHDWYIVELYANEGWPGC